MDILRVVEQENLKENAPQVDIGDYVKAYLKVKEGNRERLQAFEGTVIAKSGYGINETFTVRRIASGIGVERVLPVHSPIVDHVELIRKGQIRRAKLYYLRDRVGKSARLKEKLSTKK